MFAYVFEEFEAFRPCKRLIHVHYAKDSWRIGTQLQLGAKNIATLFQWQRWKKRKANKSFYVMAVPRRYEQGPTIPFNAYFVYWQTQHSTPYAQRASESSSLLHKCPCRYVATCSTSSFSVIFKSAIVRRFQIWDVQRIPPGRKILSCLIILQPEVSTHVGTYHPPSPI